MDNAIKYSENNFRINVSLEQITQNNIKISVGNKGIGIPAKEIPYIFNRFYRSNETRADISGNGLGLAIVKEIVELHKGEVTVESMPKEKTVFTITFPKCK